jgi:hypothetical protein
VFHGAVPDGFVNFVSVVFCQVEVSATS